MEVLVKTLNKSATEHFRMLAVGFWTEYFKARHGDEDDADDGGGSRNAAEKLCE